MAEEYFKVDASILKGVLEEHYDLELTKDLKHMTASYVGGCARVKARKVGSETVEDYLCKVVDLEQDYAGMSPTTHPDKQAVVMRHLKEKGLTCQQPVRAKDGRDCVPYPGCDRMVQLLTFLPGEDLGRKPVTKELAFDLGGLVGQYINAIKDFKHDLWEIPSLKQGIELMISLFGSMADVGTLIEVPEEKQIFETVSSNFLKQMADNKESDLKMCLNHGDIRDSNIVLMAGVAPDAGVTARYGLIDFGVIQPGPEFIDIAYTMANLISLASDVEVGKWAVQGYLSATEMTSTERELLFICVCFMAAALWFLVLQTPAESANDKEKHEEFGDRFRRGVLLLWKTGKENAMKMWFDEVK